VELGFYEELPPELPHPPIPLAILLIVEEALVEAWEVLRQRTRTGFDLVSAYEDTVTHDLYEVLCDIVLNKGRVDGFGRELFEVNREPKLRSYNGGSLDKMPDLRVSLIGGRRVAKLSQDGLFIECKPADRDHSIGAHYCDKGLIRFVNGDYAWAMREAMMVAYAREGYTVSAKLAKALKARTDAIPTLVSPKPCRSSKASKFGEVVHTSTHGRTFRYLGTDAPAPPITVRHLWLRRD